MKLTKFLLTCVAALGCVGAAYNAQAVVQPIEPSGSIIVETDGQTTEIPLRLVQLEKGVGWSVDVQTAEYRITGEGALNPDPSIAYGIAVADFGAPTSFGFFFVTPIVPTGPSTVVAASIVGGLTDLTGNGVSITPFAQSTVQVASAGPPSTSLGVDVGPAFSAPAGAPGAFHSYGPHSDGPQPGPGGIFTTLAVTASFTLSGGGDIAALTGFASIDTAPDVVPDGGPGLAGVMAIGALLAAGAARRRAGVAH
jgi:hypothetical protein